MTSVARIFISQIKVRLKIGFQTNSILTSNEVAKEQIFQTTLNANYVRTLKYALPINLEIYGC